MNLDEYINGTGIRVSKLAEFTGVSKQTIYRIRLGNLATPEIARKIKTFTGPIEIKMTTVEKKPSTGPKKRKCR